MNTKHDQCDFCGEKTERSLVVWCEVCGTKAEKEEDQCQVCEEKRRKESRRKPQLPKKHSRRRRRTKDANGTDFSYGEMTLEEVGKELGLTRERVRQIEAKAIGKLRYLLVHQLEIKYDDLTVPIPPSQQYPAPQVHTTEAEDFPWSFWAVASPEVVDIYLAKMESGDGWPWQFNKKAQRI